MRKIPATDSHVYLTVWCLINRQSRRQGYYRYVAHADDICTFPFDTSHHRSHKVPTLIGIFSFLHSHLIRAIGSDQPLSVIASIRRFAMRSNYCAAVSVSSNNRYMVVSGSRVQHCRLPRSDSMVNNGLHVHVDISRSVFGRAQTVAL